MSIFICLHGLRRSFLFLLYILGVVLLLLTKLTSSFTLLFPFFLFIYFAYVRISWVCLLARSKQVTHKATNCLTSSGVCLIVPGVLSFFPLSIVPCSRSIALLLIDPDV